MGSSLAPLLVCAKTDGGGLVSAGRWEELDEQRSVANVVVGIVVSW